MHGTYSDTQYENESKHSEMGPVRQNPIQKTARSVHVCALHCTQLLHTILLRTDLIIFPLTLQTITIALMMSIWGKKGGGHFTRKSGDIFQEWWTNPKLLTSTSVLLSILSIKSYSNWCICDRFIQKI